MGPSFRPSFWHELRRRRVVRAVTVYGVSAWVVVQVADVFFPALRLPDWTLTLVAALAVLGFPITVAIAWIYDRTPDGIRRTADADAATAPADHGPGSWAAPGADADRAPGGASGGAVAARGSPQIDRRFLLALALGALTGVLVVGGGIWLADRLRGGAPPDARAVVAVLPFETVGDANPTFTEGMHGDVLTRLSGVSGLDVISRGSVLRYRNTEQEPSEISAELGAGWILRGEVQQVGDQVQVHARLVDARRDRQVWAQAFRRELTAANLFDIQQEITRQIVVALETRLGQRAPAYPGRTTDDLEAYRLHAQGRGLLGRRTEQPMRRAAEYFQEALDRDPGYAAAWAGLADALTYLETFGFATPEHAVDAERAAKRALELDPRLAEAHFALANLAHARRDDASAVRRLEQAIVLRPSYSDAHNLLSWIEKLHGRPEAALESGERAVQLDPLGSAPLSNLALARLATGDAADAVRLARRTRELHPDFSTARFIEALALYHQGRFRAARPLVEGLEVAWAPDGPVALRALIELALGDSVTARSTLRAIDPAAHPFSHSLVRLGLGRAGGAQDPSAAIAAIAAIERWEYWPTFAARFFFPEALAPLRADPRYREILRRIDRSWGRTP